MSDYRLARRPGSPVWYIAWSEHGRSRRYSTGARDRGQAELALAALRLERSAPAEAPSAPGRVGLAAVLEAYAPYAETRPSAHQARIAGAHLRAHFPLTTVADLDAGALEGYAVARRAAGVRDPTIARELSVLRAALNRAVASGLLAAAPLVPALPEAPPRERVLTRAEAARLLDACRPPRRRHLALFIRLALYTGARRGAVLELTWDRVDLARRLIHFALPGRSPTAKRRVSVPVEGPLYTALARARARAEALARGPQVVDWGGRPAASLRRSFAAAARAAGLGPEVTPNTLRHTAASWARAGGADLYAIAALLGHSQLRTTQRYAKYGPDYLRAVTAAIRRPPPRARPGLEQTAKPAPHLRQSPKSPR